MYRCLTVVACGGVLLVGGLGCRPTPPPAPIVHGRQTGADEAQVRAYLQWFRQIDAARLQMVRRHNEDMKQAKAVLPALQTFDKEPQNPPADAVQKAFARMARNDDEKARFLTRFRQNPPPLVCAKLARAYIRYLSVTAGFSAYVARRYAELATEAKRPDATPERQRTMQRGNQIVIQENAPMLYLSAARIGRELQEVRVHYPELPDELVGWKVEPF